MADFNDEMKQYSGTGAALDWGCPDGGGSDMNFPNWEVASMEIGIPFSSIAMSVLGQSCLTDQRAIASVVSLPLRCSSLLWSPSSPREEEGWRR